MKRLRFTFLAVVTLLYCGCTDNNLTGPHYVNQFPLRVGIFWEYESSNYILHREIISYGKMSNGQWAYKLRTELLPKNVEPRVAVSSPGFTFLRLQENELREYYESDCKAYSVWLQFPLEFGQNWFQNVGSCTEVLGCDTLENVVICSVRIYSRGPAWDTVAYWGEVTTPYSKFEDCWGIKVSGLLPSYKLAWFKAGIGIVKYEQYGLLLGEDFVLTDFGQKRGWKFFK